MENPWEERVGERTRFLHLSRETFPNCFVVGVDGAVLKHSASPPHLSGAYVRADHQRSADTRYTADMSAPLFTTPPPQPSLLSFSLSFFQTHIWRMGSFNTLFTAASNRRQFVLQFINAEQFV